MTRDEQIRATFAVHCGAEQYQRFLEVFNRVAVEDGRFTFFQRKLWDSFTKQHSQLSCLAFNEIVSIFRVCYVHGNQLKPRQIRAIPDLIDILYSKEYVEAVKHHFPYAPDTVLLPDGVTETTCLVCPACIRARDEFNRHLSEGC